MTKLDEKNNGEKTEFVQRGDNVSQIKGLKGKLRKTRYYVCAVIHVILIPILIYFECFFVFEKGQGGEEFRAHPWW